MRDILVRRLNDWGAVKAEELADYLLANGVFVPPYKIGDIVYFLSANQIKSGKIVEIYTNGYDFSFGVELTYTTVTLLREEVYRTPGAAEKAIKSGEALYESLCNTAETLYTKKGGAE